MTKITAQTLKGFRDFLPGEARKRLYVINTLRKVFESFGFEPLETPALEYEDVLLGKYGEEGDKLMYRFTDNGGRKVALRYDQTVPLARVVAQYGETLPTPFKRYQIQPVWRAENTQKGRFREFLQCDIDTVGLESVYVDAELVAVVVKALESLGFKDFKVLINDRNVFSQLVLRTAITEEELPKAVRILDKIKKIGREGVVDELSQTGFGSERATYILQAIESYQPTELIQNIFQGLEAMGITKDKYQFSPTLARGLDYYTGMILEVEVEGYSGGSVAGGGRYDNLIGMFTDKQIPANGLAFGFDRLVEAIEELKLFPADLTTTQALVTVFSMELGQEAVNIANKLREAGINTELWLDANSKLEKQLKYADQKGIPYAIIIGLDEVSSDKVTLKDLKTQTQETIQLDEVIQKLRL